MDSAEVAAIVFATPLQSFGGDLERLEAALILSNYRPVGSF
jgi:hypothetical protein